MLGAPMIKKINFFAAQDKEYLPTCDTVTIFTPEEIEAFKKEAFKICVTRGNRFYQQAGAYILMLNTGLRVGELAGLLNEDIDLENRVLHVRRSVKEVYHREDGSIKSLSPRQVADLLGHSTSEVTEMYYVRRDTTRLKGITQGFDL